MNLRRVFTICLIAIAVLALVEPVNALLWPPAIGSCGYGGLWGLYGPLGPFGAVYWGFGPYCGGFW